MKVAIINSGGANIASILFALERLNVIAKLTSDATEIKKASHVILPGVGAAKIAMENLQQLKLIDTIRSLTQPVLGICLGMQLLYEFSEEGNVPCLGVVKGNIAKLQPQPQLTIPHMGWNTLKMVGQSPLFKNIEDSSYVYFVHSYAAPITNATIAATNYNQNFTAAMQQENFFGTQFHPERSGEVGSKILYNFINT